MKIIYYPLLDEVRDKAQDLARQIKNYNLWKIEITDDINRANVILVGWWDGFLLDTISKYEYYNKIFLGLNCWTKWFLLNEIDNITELPIYLNEIEIIEEKFIKVETVTDNHCTVRYAVNDIVIGNNLWSMFKIKVKWEDFKHTIDWTWIIVSNNIGSTWYWLSWWWPLIPLKTDLRWIMWMFSLPFNYDIVNPQIINIETISRYPTHVWIDGKSWLIENATEIKLSPTEKSFKLGFLNYKKFEVKRLTLYKEKLGVKNI